MRFNGGHEGALTIATQRQRVEVDLGVIDARTASSPAYTEEDT